MYIYAVTRLLIYIYTHTHTCMHAYIHTYIHISSRYIYNLYAMNI